MDGSEVAVSLLRANAERASCAERIETHVADLEADPPEFAIEPAAYDLVVDCYFLHRPLFAAVREAVRPGGRFVAALHLPAAGGHHGHGFVLQPGELERMVREWRWDVLHATERAARVAPGNDPGVAEIVARRPDPRAPVVW